MSDLQSQFDNLRKENENLRAQVQQAGNVSSGLSAQLDAHKQTLNDSMAGLLHLRTQLILAERQIQSANAKVAEEQKKLTGVNLQLMDATKRIAELEKAAADASAQQAA